MGGVLDDVWYVLHLFLVDLALLCFYLSRIYPSVSQKIMMNSIKRYSIYFGLMLVVAVLEKIHKIFRFPSKTPKITVDDDHRHVCIFFILLCRASFTISKNKNKNYNDFIGLVCFLFSSIFFLSEKWNTIHTAISLETMTYRQYISK